MIYEFPPLEAAIRQGDIFVGLPRVDVPLRKIIVAGNDDDVETDWDLIVQAGLPITAVLPVRPVTAIVASQDCDASHNPDVTLCEVRNFRDVERKAKDTQSVKSWISILTQQARLNLKWFYLPPDEQIGFKDKLAVDFTVTLRVPRSDLEDSRHLRKGRLNPLADEHFRERIAEFFRRYPYDEWYPLNNEELAEYKKSYPDAEPKAWQV
ncbi:MAG: hypothetical protein HZA51_12980 [Planctomycetes bacterium]|nr:hypothetical protein [Planctomycetota bacterium]